MPTASRQRTPAEVLGFDNDQLFFLSYAQSWRGRIATRRCATRSSPKATLAQYRTYTVRNLDAWYDAFQVKPDKLYISFE